MKTIDRLKKDHRVEDAWSEEDGHFVMLKDGFADKKFDPHFPTHTIHEWTFRGIMSRMKDVKPCDCQECKEGNQ